MVAIRRLALAIACAGCGPVVPVDDGGTSGGATSAGATTVGSATVGTTTVGTTSFTTSVTSVGEAEVSTAVDESSTDSKTTVGFIPDPDGGGVSIECNLWLQDCPVGEKCMPWANDGGNAWNATRCTPLAKDPRQPGEECTVEGSGVSGIDDCDISAMCWSVDPETLMGYCVPFCGGSRANPTCEGACETCPISGDGVLILCLPGCDPLLQDCGEGEACLAANDAFVCAPDASGEMGALGDPCEFLNVCDPGLFCADADSVPGCEGSGGCCAPFCDAGGTDVCDMLLPGTSCVPWYEDGMQPEGCTEQLIGACLLPE